MPYNGTDRAYTANSTSRMVSHRGHYCNFSALTILDSALTSYDSALSSLDNALS